MTSRIANPAAAAPAAYKAMLALEAALKNSGLEYSLFELVKTRASQINACAFCIYMHTRDARKAGESEARLYLLPTWRESSLYTPRERAALAWTESLTLLASRGAPEEEFQELKLHFTEAEIVNLTLLIGTINSWNRFSVGLANPHGVAPGDKPAA